MNIKRAAGVLVVVMATLSVTGFEFFLKLLSSFKIISTFIEF